MIINCNKCNKDFKVDNSLIPENGRLLQCGHCKNEWFFKPNISSKNKDLYNNNLTKINEFMNQDSSSSLDNSNKIKLKENKSNLSIINNDKKLETNKKNNYMNVLNYLIIFIITFAAIILIVDTFKINLSKINPKIIPALDNLYAIFFDLKLFLKDLFY